MNLITIVFYISISITSINGRSLEKNLALDKNYLLQVENKHSEELRCLKRFDDILHSKWKSEVDKISTKDLGEIIPDHSLIQTSKPIYPTPVIQWLMENGSPCKNTDECFRDLIKRLNPILEESDKKCLNELISSHVEIETKLVKEANLVEKSSRDLQLPFRRFLNFQESVEVMFQNRKSGLLTPIEEEVYDFAKRQLSDEEDKERKMFVIRKDCEWKNLKALHETSNENAKLKEFESQVRDLVNHYIGVELLPSDGFVNLTHINDQEHKKWLSKREAMETRLKKEILHLQNQNKSSQWLCDYAAELARDFSLTQSSILAPSLRHQSTYLKITDIARETRAVEVVLKKREDVRQGPIDLIANGMENDARCMQAFTHLLQQHHSFETASAFVDTSYTYPELHCYSNEHYLGRIYPSVCNCIGSFCVKYGLDGLREEEYKLIRDNDGVYKVVRVDDVDNKGAVQIGEE